MLDCMLSSAAAPIRSHDTTPAPALTMESSEILFTPAKSRLLAEASIVSFGRLQVQKVNRKEVSYDEKAGGIGSPILNDMSK
jgi:hypothetical protein